MGTHVSTDISIAAVYEAAVDTMKRASDSKTGLSGTTTGYDSIDSFTGGFAKGDLIILAGLPGTFKSALAISFIWKAAKRGTPTHMFQLEMDRSQVGMRIIAAETGIDINRLKTGMVSDTERAFVEKVEDRIVSTPMSVDVSSNLTISQIINSSAKVVRERGVEIIVVDYLQLADLEKGKDNTDESAIDTAVRRLKVAAKKLGVTLILLAGFNREGNKDHKRPPKIGRAHV